MEATYREYNIRLSIDSRLEQVRVLSGALRGIGQELSLSEEQLGQLELMMVEAVNNVIEHAYQMQHGNGAGAGGIQPAGSAFSHFRSRSRDAGCITYRNP